jgi:hypothetical protein
MASAWLSGVPPDEHLAVIFNLDLECSRAATHRHLAAESVGKLASHCGFQLHGLRSNLPAALEFIGRGAVLFFRQQIIEPLHGLGARTVFLGQRHHEWPVGYR